MPAEAIAEVKPAPAPQNTPDSALGAEKPRSDYSYQVALSQTVQRVVVDRLMWLAQTARGPEVKAMAQMKLSAFLATLPEVQPGELAGAAEGTAHVMALSADIRRFLERPWDPAALPKPMAPPPGMPIGEEP